MMKRYAATALLFTLWGTSLMAAVTEIKTMNDYKELCARDKPFVLMFYAPWCGACNGMKEPYDQVSAGTQDVIMAKVSVDNPELKSLKEAFCITAVPTLITRQSGMMSKEDLNTLIKGHIRQPIPQKVTPQPTKAQPTTKKTTT